MKILILFITILSINSAFADKFKHIQYESEILMDDSNENGYGTVITRSKIKDDGVICYKYFTKFVQPVCRGVDADIPLIQVSISCVKVK